MIEFNKYPATSNDGNQRRLTIASGPVIIQDGKVLFDKNSRRINVVPEVSVAGN